MVSGRLAALDTPEALKRRYVPGRMLEVQDAPPGLIEFPCQRFGAGLHVRVPDEVSAESLRSTLAARGARDVRVSETETTLEDVFLAVAQP
jgi:hypothetical protein